MPLFTKREIQLVAFVVGAVLVGFAVQHYRQMDVARDLAATVETGHN